MFGKGLPPPSAGRGASLPCAGDPLICTWDKEYSYNMDFASDCTFALRPPYTMQLFTQPVVQN